MSRTQRGGAAVPELPVHVQSRLVLPDGVEDAVRAGLGRRLATAAPSIAHVTVRFDEYAGAGGAFTDCIVEVELTGHATAHATERAADPAQAFTRVLPRIVAAVERSLGKNGHRERTAPPGGDEGSIIGRRVGHGEAALERALARPTDDASTARRNSKRSTEGMTAMLEDSRTRPSRKSTRKSANHGKPSQMIERTAHAKAHTPKAEATRARARDRR